MYCPYVLQTAVGIIICGTGNNIKLQFCKVLWHKKCNISYTNVAFFLHLLYRHISFFLNPQFKKLQIFSLYAPKNQFHKRRSPARPAQFRDNALLPGKKNDYRYPSEVPAVSPASTRGSQTFCAESDSRYWSRRAYAPPHFSRSGMPGCGTAVCRRLSLSKKCNLPAAAGALFYRHTDFLPHAC